MPSHLKYIFRIASPGQINHLTLHLKSYILKTGHRCNDKHVDFNVRISVCIITELLSKKIKF